MKKRIVFYFVLLAIPFQSCIKTEPNPIPTAETIVSVLTTNAWKMDKITDLNGNAINVDLLPTEAKFFFGVNIQFRDDNTVRATDPVDRRLVNGGVWAFKNDNKTLYIDLNKDFKGDYLINKLTRSNMSLRNTMEMNGIKFEVNLELVPSL
ncbi:MAG: hypothetical protein R2822_27115 [Spirosomataceae bacterium]